MATNANKTNQSADQQSQGGEAGTAAAESGQLPIGVEAEVAVADKTPEWVRDVLKSNLQVITSHEALIASNDSVIASNDAVIEAVAKFNEHATGLVREIMEAAKGHQGENSETSSVTLSKVVEIDPDAEYIVAPGKSFHNKDNGQLQGPGDDVTHFEPERLKNLISQGIVIEA